MDRKIWIRKLHRRDAERAEREDYAILSPERRLEIVQELRELASRIGNEDRKGLRRVLTIIKRP